MRTGHRGIMEMTSNEIMKDTGPMMPRDTILRVDRNRSLGPAIRVHFSGLQLDLEACRSPRSPADVPEPQLLGGTLLSISFCSPTKKASMCGRMTALAWSEVGSRRYSL